MLYFSYVLYHGLVLGMSSMIFYYNAYNASETNQGDTSIILPHRLYFVLLKDINLSETCDFVYFVLIKDIDLYKTCYFVSHHYGTNP